MRACLLGCVHVYVYGCVIGFVCIFITDSLASSHRSAYLFTVATGSRSLGYELQVG